MRRSRRPSPSVWLGRRAGLLTRVTYGTIMGRVSGPSSSQASSPVSRGRSLADRYRRFADAAVAGASPLCARVALALSESDAALAAISKAPARKRHPKLILAALHYLALSGEAPDLAAAFADRDGERPRSVAPSSASRSPPAPDRPKRQPP